MWRVEALISFIFCPLHERSHILNYRFVPPLLSPTALSRTRLRSERRLRLSPLLPLSQTANPVQRQVHLSHPLPSPPYIFFVQSRFGARVSIAARVAGILLLTSSDFIVRFVFNSCRLHQFWLLDPPPLNKSVR
jgi:hypothetical protein